MLEEAEFCSLGMWAAYGITFLKFVDVAGAMGTNVQLLFFLAPG